MKSEDAKAFREALGSLLEDKRVGKMKNYTQHGSITTYDHCCSVARLSLRINHLLRLKADEEDLVQGAMLHDYFLYDWHENHHDENGWHGFSHAETALRNAREDFDIDPQVAHIIQSHMCPLNITRIPRTREAWIVCIADKWVSAQETLLSRSKSGNK